MNEPLDKVQGGRISDHFKLQAYRCKNVCNCSFLPREIHYADLYNIYINGLRAKKELSSTNKSYKTEHSGFILVVL